MKYVKVFEDKFDKGILDKKKWKIENKGGGFGNWEKQYYSNRDINVDLSCGFLKLISRKEKFKGHEYTSGKIISYPNQLFRFGKIEIEAILPKGVGTWPAIWLLGAAYEKNIKWPLCGEIDIMEHVGHNPNQIHVSLHSKNRNFKNPEKNELTAISKIDKPMEKKHVYGITWNHGSITFTIDGKELVTYKDSTGKYEDWPFNEDFYLIINNAVGGAWGGPVNDSDLPSEFKIFRVTYYKEI